MTMIGTQALKLRLRARMWAGLRRRGSARDSNILFVIGTGRSGTHFVTRCLIGNDHITDLIGGEENPIVFSTITAAALDQRRAGELLPKAKRAYDALAAAASPDWLVDQSHPNIWFAEGWAETYPHAHFVGMIRNPYAVVASMMKHAGVRAWAIDWQRHPVPNPFLGITTDNTDRYAAMSLAERCALRWISHQRRLDELTSRLGKRLSVVDYNQLCTAPDALLGPIVEKLGLEPAFNLPRVDRSALTRGADMTGEDAAAVRRLLVEAEVHPQWLDIPW